MQSKPLETATEQMPATPPISDRLAVEARRDAVFFVLSNYRRRFVLEYVLEHSGPLALRELAEGLAARENDIGVEETTSVQRKRAYVSLRQTHLPKLDETGMVQFDSGRGTVEPGPQLNQVGPYLRAREIEQVRNWRRVARVSITTTLILVAGLIGVLVL